VPDANAGNKASIRQQSQEYGLFSYSHRLSLQGMHWQNGGDDDVLRLRPHVLADDQKLTTGKKYAGAQTEVFLRGNYKFRDEE
jgi:hypothetical protein